ncbi:MAG: Mth938-like domain-containing protein [Pseudomonadota bacterium]
MQLSEVSYGAASPVTGYGPGFFRIGERVIEGAMRVLPAGAGPWSGYDDAAVFIGAAGDIDVLLLGTGAETAHPPQSFRDAIEAAGIGLEPMASPAACRTYNVLLGEGRRIGLAVLPV